MACVCVDCCCDGVKELFCFSIGDGVGCYFCAECVTVRERRACPSMPSVAISHHHSRHNSLQKSYLSHHHHHQ